MVLLLSVESKFSVIILVLLFFPLCLMAKFAPFFQPIRSNLTKTNRDQFARVFLHLALIICIFLEF